MNKLFAVALAVLAIGAKAQTIGNSPYGAFGLGDVKYSNDIDIWAMGGISTAYIPDFNNSFNFVNPAANSNLELTSLRGNVTNENQYLKSDYGGGTNTKRHSTYFSDISLAFPITKKMKFGIGFQPYSSKSYSITSTGTDANGNSFVNAFNGKGTVNTLQAAVSYQLTPSFGVGLRSNLYFGNLTDLQEFVGNANTELYNGYLTENHVNSYNFTLGTTYQKKLKDNHKFTLGATYTFGNIGNMRSTFTNSTYYYSSNTKVNESIIEQKDFSGKNYFPQHVSVGAGYGNDGKWFASGQIDYTAGHTVNFLGNAFHYKNDYRFALGGWYLPNYNNFRNYFSRVIYRGGIYYETGSLNINHTLVREYGLSLGMNLPFEKASITRMSGLDLAVEVGRRGTTFNNLVLQNFVNFKVGFTFSDQWFMKRIFN